MDPVSATVAFVGLTASIVTLGALITESLQTLYDLRDRLVHAPENIRKLGDIVQPLGTVLTELKHMVINENDISVQWKSLWAYQLIQMEQDLRGFKRLVDKLNRRLKGNSVLGPKVWSRLQYGLLSKAVARHKRLLTSHVQSLQMIQSHVISVRTARSIQDFRLRTQINADEHSRDLRAAYGETTMSRRVARRSSEPANSIAREPRKHQGSKRNLQGCVIEESNTHCFLDQTGLSFSKNTRESPDQDQFGVTELLTLRPTTMRIHRPYTKLDAGECSRPRTYYHSLSWQVLIGRFEYEMVLKPQSAVITNTTTNPEGHKSDICFFRAKYIVPLWFSNTVVQMTYQTGLQCGATNWYRDLSFGMYNTNPDPSLLECLDSGDAEGLRHLFRKGRARATDYLVNGETLLRYAVSQASYRRNYSRSNVMKEKHLGVVQFLLAQGAKIECLGNHISRVERFGYEESVNRHMLACTKHFYYPRVQDLDLVSLLLRYGDEIHTETLRGYMCGQIEHLTAHLQPFVDEVLFSEQPQDIRLGLGILGLEYPQYRKFCKTTIHIFSPAGLVSPMNWLQQQSVLVSQAEPALRHRIGLWVLENGTTNMIEHVFKEWIDVNEPVDGRISNSYISSARVHIWNRTTLKILLDCGAKPRVQHMDGKTHGHARQDRNILRQVIIHHRESCQRPLEPWLPVLNELLSRGFHRFPSPSEHQYLYLGPEVLTAVASNNATLLQFLAGHGASLTYEECGSTPLTLAVTYGFADIVRILLSANRNVFKDAEDRSHVCSLSNGYLRQEHPRPVLCVLVAHPDSTEWQRQENDDSMDRWDTSRQFDGWKYTMREQFPGHTCVSFEIDEAINVMLMDAPRQEYATAFKLQS